MKTYHTPLRSNCNFATVFKRKAILRDCDVMHNVHRARAEQDALMEKVYSGRPTKIRITNVKKKTGGYHVVGMGFVSGTFDEVKNKMKSAGYTGWRMGGLKFSLN